MRFPEVTFASAAAAYSTAGTPRQLSRGYADGSLVRLRRGVYVPTEQWLGGTASDRYAITTASLAVGGPSPVLCRETALLAWGVELPRTPTHVRYRTANAARAGAVRPQSIYGNQAQARKAWAAAAREDNWPLPSGFPDARHLWRPDRSQPLLLPTLGLSLSMEPFDAVLADTLHRLPFVDAVTVVDALLARRQGLKANRTLDELQALMEALPNASARARMAFVLGFADGASESVGESFSRALMWELGFEIPELQVWITADGRDIARVDYCWRRIRLTGEFDGLRKYTRSHELGGKSASDVVVAEKRREDQIRGNRSRDGPLDLGRPPGAGPVRCDAGSRGRPAPSMTAGRSRRCEGEHPHCAQGCEY